jgi:hypothetical protein
VICKVLVGSFHEDLQVDQGSWTNINSTLARKLMWPMLMISTLIFTHTNVAKLIYSIFVFFGSKFLYFLCFIFFELFLHEAAMLLRYGICFGKIVLHMGD